MNTALTVIENRSADGTLAVKATGEIDLSNVDAFTTALQAALSQTGDLLTVDLAEVNYLDSAAINALFQHADHIRIVANRLLTAILTISGLADMVEVTTV
ncbi:STAS domain-containing protein [Mycobacterium sp. NPDC003323]